VNLSNTGINVFDVSVQLTGDIDSTNNKLSTSDTAFNVKPTAAFTMTNSGNTYNFTPAVIGKNPITYKWNFGDGSPVSNLPNPSHHYSYVSAYYAKLVVTDACGGSDSISKIVNITVGMNHPKTDNYFQIYPNPANDRVTITTINPAKASVLYFTDITGNLLLEVTPDSNGQYDLKVADYANGMYFLRIDNQIQKMLINH
jgi:PKD repeat protein